MSIRTKAFLFTAIPVLFISLISLFSKQPDLNKDLGIAWLIAGGIWIIELLTAIGLYMKKRKEVALGMLAGSAGGFASLVITMILFIVLHEAGNR